MITSLETLFKPFISVTKPENTFLPLVKFYVAVNNTHFTVLLINLSPNFLLPFPVIFLKFRQSRKKGYEIFSGYPFSP